MKNSPNALNHLRATNQHFGVAYVSGHSKTLLRA